MVAISLYRGNLHRVPDLPRRWLMPTPKYSIKDFKSLHARRSKALSRLHPTTSNPNPNPTPFSNTQNGSPRKVTANHDEGKPNTPVKEEEQQQHHHTEPEPVAASSGQIPLNEYDLLIDPKNGALEKASNGGATSTEKHDELFTDNRGLLTDKEKRKKEVEDKLQVLNAKKHNLVLMLKQILNVEEELKRQNSVQMQGVAMHATSIPPQPDGTNETGLLTSHLTTRSEGNLVGDVDGGSEVGDSPNHNAQHYRHVLRTCSMSPSSEVPRPLGFNRL